MKQANDFAYDMLDLDVRKDKLLYYCSRDVILQEEDGDVNITTTFKPVRHNGIFEPAGNAADEKITFTLKAYDDEVLRFSGSFNGEVPDEKSVMLSLDTSLDKRPLSVCPVTGGWELRDDQRNVRMRILTEAAEERHWSDFIRKAYPMFQAELFPDGKTSVPFMSYDQFFPGKLDSVSLGFTRDGMACQSLFSLYSRPNEHFTGTGERFARMDLSGRTITLENTDALGVNSRKTYLNVPFYLSSRGYGLFIHSSSHMRLSFADISTRAVQGLLEEGSLDLFFIGGSSPERILSNYRRLTGFPPEVPLWSYGIWMSRMSYFSAAEVEKIGDRLRDEDYPCDVFHLDSGYFKNDWICDWKFSKERFPKIEEFLHKMRIKGYRFSVWQTPNIGKENPLNKEATEKKYLPPVNEDNTLITASDFSGQDFGGQIDFTNPDAAEWYKNLLRGLLDIGIACIKTDFGEKILMNADFMNMNSQKLHNMYALLYQKNAFEVSGEYCEEPIIWARSGWAGAQRFPLHWGGDTAATWDGMAGTLRGGLHLGLSGFTLWSHDVPGFHGLPEFSNTWPSAALYLRWTQFGTFTSHMRYHGTSPREPWEYPEVSDLVRKWWKLRYALIPYLVSEANYASKGGLPMLAALLFHHYDDPIVWHIDDQYYLGRDFLVSPVMNGAGERDVYLPDGEWVDFWTGEMHSGKKWIGIRQWPPAIMPLFVRKNAQVPFYPTRVEHTGQMDLNKSELIRFDKSYNGLMNTFLRSLTGFTQKDIDM